MEPTQEFVDALYREKVESAASMPLSAKLLAGAELFDAACVFVRAGIRAQTPGISEDEVERELRWRLELGRRLAGSPVELSGGPEPVAK